MFTEESSSKNPKRRIRKSKMKNILLFEDFIQDLSIPKQTQDAIKNWLSKYAKDYDMHDDAEFESNSDKMVKDCMSQLEIDKSMEDDVRSFIQSIQDISDGFSIIMDPKPTPNLNPIDNVQRFNY
jgi:hypothetical protein